jgi:hypothetical protein
MRMMASSSTYEALGSKESFNASVRHIKATVALAERISGGENLADILNELLDEKSVSSEEIQPFVSMLLAEKFTYRFAACNLSSLTGELTDVHNQVSKWNALDLVVVYSHPDLGVIVLNPKNKAHTLRIDRLNKRELLVVYAGAFGKDFDARLADKACSILLDLYQGKKPKEDSALHKGSCTYKPKQVEKPVSKGTVKTGKVAKVTSGSGRAVVAKPSPRTVAEPVTAPDVAMPTPAAATAPIQRPGSRMTPMYAVRVANELFHNGNVEAWKRIIDSYKVKHQDLEVVVYYDGERITNLNALFKWGKVKHGSVIQFAVVGENICDVAKLQRYLAQGASSMFEAFLRGPVNGVLSLF